MITKQNCNSILLDMQWQTILKQSCVSVSMLWVKTASWFQSTISLRASSPILGEPRENLRARGRGKESLQWSLINFHFHPGNPGTLQSVKTVTANVPQIRKVTTACQVSLDSRGRVELFIYKSLSQQHQSNVFNHWYVFFFTGTSNFNVSARIRTHYFDSRFVYFWKVVHTAV